MAEIRFLQPDCRIDVPEGTTLLEAALKAGIELNTQCGGEGICGKCRMIVREGDLSDRETWTFTANQIEEGYVLACMTSVRGDMTVTLPDAVPLKKERPGSVPEFSPFEREYHHRPVVEKIHMKLEPPTLFTGQSDHQMVEDRVKSDLKISTMQMGLKTIGALPGVLRKNSYDITVTVGLRRQIAEIMAVEGGDRSGHNYLAAVDMGTTTVVASILDGASKKILHTLSTYNSQAVHGAEITARMIHCERKGMKEMQSLLVNDINELVASLCEQSGILTEEINGIICTGNTAICHFLLGLPTDHIRRRPFIPVIVEPPPLRAAETGLSISPRGLLYCLPGISGWVGSDLTAGILAISMHRRDQLTLLVDIGTNGEVILGNREWLIAASASAGPALEGASVECGMRAERGAVDKVWLENGEIRFDTIEHEAPTGICGSGIIDLVSVLLEKKIINRSGRFLGQWAEEGRYSISDRVFMTEKDIENIITAKAAIFSAIKILLDRMSLHFHDLDRIFIAGSFGYHLDAANAVAIGLLPPVSTDIIRFAGNTSLTGAAMAALHQEAFYELSRIREMTTYYDLLGAEDYVDEFRKAMFLPHTDIDYWRALE